MNNEYIEFEPGTKYPIKNGDISDTPDTFRDCGYILKEDEIVVDIDVLTHDKIKSLITMFNINTQTVWTDRGAHFYFKKPLKWRRKEKICHLGFNVEYKHSGNTKAVTIKRNGILRTIDNEGVREDLPPMFTDKGKFENLLGLSEGESRNNKLYAHKMSLGNCTGWVTMLQYINNFVFDVPLDPKEFADVSRQEVISTDKEAFENIIADELIKRLDTLLYGGNLYFRDLETGEFSNDEGKLIRLVYQTAGDVKTTVIDEIIKQIRYKSKLIPNDTIFNIRFNNGVLFDGKFVELSEYREFTPYSLDVSYNKDAESVELVDNYINHLTDNDEDYKKLLMEVLGHTLVVDPEFKRLLAKFFIFVGSGGNGKGTLLQIIRGILGGKNCTSMNIKQMSDERYLSQFKGKLANLGDDIQDSAINDKDMKVLKNLSTCDDVSSRELYKNSQEMKFTGSLIFTSNHLIKSFEKGDSYKRRVLWMPMYTKVTKKDPLFITNLTSPKAVEYWIKLIVEGYMRLYAQNTFTESEKVNEFNKKYHRENNPYLDYLDDKEESDFIGKPVSDIRSDVQDWCNENDEELKYKMFQDTLRELYNIEARNVKNAYTNGRSTRMYMPIEDTRYREVLDLMLEGKF